MKSHSHPARMASPALLRVFPFTEALAHPLAQPRANAAFIPIALPQKSPRAAIKLSSRKICRFLLQMH
ncbi:hypothetical protein [Aureimonas ureilytica]|uniref:hypothetical protein n=1 Tax=Aureimonas ureilytica TaxID=401562 RepID=UPI00128EA64F|nr:hypothetical protein [Aureimonas ureilytica]